MPVINRIKVGFLLFNIAVLEYLCLCNGKGPWNEIGLELVVHTMYFLIVNDVVHKVLPYWDIVNDSSCDKSPQLSCYAYFRPKRRRTEGYLS